MIVKFHPNEYIPLESVFERISAAETDELADIVQVLTARYQELHPDWEVQFLALPKDPTLQVEYLQRIIDLIHATQW